MTTTPSIYVALGLLDALLNTGSPLLEVELEEACDWFTDHFSADEHDLATVELAAFMEALP